jgi:hypothetical protein
MLSVRNQCGAAVRRLSRSIGDLRCVQVLLVPLSRPRNSSDHLEEREVHWAGRIVLVLGIGCKSELCSAITNGTGRGHEADLHRTSGRKASAKVGGQLHRLDALEIEPATPNPDSTCWLSMRRWRSSKKPIPRWEKLASKSVWRKALGEPGAGFALIHRAVSQRIADSFAGDARPFFWCPPNRHISVDFRRSRKTLEIMNAQLGLA